MPTRLRPAVLRFTFPGIAALATRVRVPHFRLQKKGDQHLIEYAGLDVRFPAHSATDLAFWHALDVTGRNRCNCQVLYAQLLSAGSPDAANTSVAYRTLLPNMIQAYWLRLMGIHLTESLAAQGLCTVVRITPSLSALDLLPDAPEARRMGRQRRALGRYFLDAGWQENESQEDLTTQTLMYLLRSRYPCPLCGYNPPKDTRKAKRFDAHLHQAGDMVICKTRLKHLKLLPLPCFAPLDDPTCPPVPA